MIRVVLDTNIIISAWLWQGVPAEIFAAAERGAFMPITSVALLSELYEVCCRPKFSPLLQENDESPEKLMRRYCAMAEMVESLEIPFQVVRDPADREVLGCAAGGGAQFVVTGDDDLLSLTEYEGISIVTAGAFHLWLRAKEG